MNNYDYPVGSDTSDSPWNQDDLPEKEIEVTISMTISKTVKITVDDYIIDEDGCYDFSECDLHKAVEEQINLPNDLAEYTERMFNHDLDLKAAGMPLYLKNAINDCKDWCLDDFEIIKE